MADYKASKEAFVSGTTGSSISHINLVCAVALSSIALYSALRSRLPTNKSLVFPAEWLILVAPLILSTTLFANSPGLLSLIFLFPTVLLMLVPRRESGTPLPSISITSPTSRRSSPEPQLIQKAVMLHVPALTTYRSHMMLMTVLSILAVDFPIFPRSLAKCETYGVSYMDIGVGSFVFSQGIVSAIPVLKTPVHLSAPIMPKVILALRKSFPILCLGFLRVLLVKSVEYPEHETEYGTHWNFFFTLAAVPVLQVLLHPFLVHVPVSTMGALAAVSHQVALSFGMRDYVLLSPRTNLLAANKEGIVSLMGYLSIHLFGLSTGTMILPPSPSYFHRQQRAFNAIRQRDGNASVPVPVQTSGQRENDKTAIELCSYAIIWWVCLGLCSLLKVDHGVSRRLANLPYILWISAFNASFILGFMLLDLCFFPSPLSKSVYSPTSKLKVHADSRRFPMETQQAGASSVLLEAINRNGLLIFLLGNVITGLVNIAFPTMYMSDLSAMVTLFVYGFGVCLVAWVMKDRKMI